MQSGFEFQESRNKHFWAAADVWAVLDRQLSLRDGCESGKVTSRSRGLQSEGSERQQQQLTCEQPAIPAGVEQAPGGEEAQQATWD